MQWIHDTIASLSAETNNAAEGAPSPSVSEGLQSCGQLSKGQLLQFFQEGEKLLQSEETRRKLKDARLLKQDVEELITTLQKEVLERLGIEGTFGIEFLGKVSALYKEDNQVMAALLKFASLEEDALDEAELPQEEYEQKQRLIELAKAHTAQLMAKLEELPPDQRQGFLRDQMKVADEIRRSIATNAATDASRSGSGAFNSSMNRQEQLNFFKSVHKGGEGGG